MIDWKAALKAIFSPKAWIAAACPICGEKLYHFEELELDRCKNGHEFGESGARVDLINSGDHRAMTPEEEI